jgi:hypothetical protein
MKAFLRLLVLAVAACVLAPQADAQQGRWRDRGQGQRGGPPPQQYRHAGPPPGGGMSYEQRERMRQDMTSARKGYRDGGPPPEYDPRRAPQRQMTPEERDRFRRDIQNANRDFERRR